MVSISVGNVTRKEQAQKFVDAIQGKSYMDFQVKFAPAGGSFEVWVETAYFNQQQIELANKVNNSPIKRAKLEAYGHKDVQEMLNLVMFSAINRS
jgi:hypothetical protein